MKLTHLAVLGLIVGCAPAAASRAAPEGPRLAFPLACKLGVTCEIQNYVDRDPGPGAQDYRCGTRTYEAHNGVDIRLRDMAAQRAGVEVLAAAPGRVARLRDGVADVSVKDAGPKSVAGQECGNGVVIDHGDGWETQYCHLAKGSLKVKVGEPVQAGQAIARVGLSGNTEYPHLHLAVRHGGVLIDPFAPTPGAACDPRATSGAGLWNPSTAKVMTYQSGAVLNAGFAPGAVSMAEVEAGVIPRVSPDAAGLVAYVRAIGLKSGDVQELILKSPDGTILATNQLAPLDRDKAQYLLYAGKKRPGQGWARGEYQAVYTVRRGGGVVISRTLRLAL